jgi:transposase
LIRLLLNDAQWQRVAPLLPGKEGDPGRSGEDNRRYVEAVLWIVRAGAPWRDLQGNASRPADRRAARRACRDNHSHWGASGLSLLARVRCC